MSTAPHWSDNRRPDATSLLAKINESERARLRVYIGAAPGVGKTYQMLEDAHQLRRQGVDVVIGYIEPHARADTIALVEGLDIVPRRVISYRDVKLEEMDVDAIKARKPQMVVVDELAHTNAPGSLHDKRYEDVLDLLNRGISVITAMNIQHIESLNDVVARSSGIHVRETVPDWFLHRADEVVNVDVSVETLRTRLLQGKIYGVEKIEQALNNFFRKGNLSTLRELALRQLAMNQADQAHQYREREGLEDPAIPEKIMVAMASSGSAKKLLRTGSRIAGRLASDWYAVYVETPSEEPGNITPAAHGALMSNINFAEHLGARVVKLKGKSVADALVEFARREGMTHVIFGQSARSRWDLFWRGSIINRFLTEVRNATVHVVPQGSDEEPTAVPAPE